MKPPKHLLDEWYKKLEDSGFNDIENYEYSSYSMSNVLDKHPFHPDVWQAKADYYELASTFLQEHKFETDMDKLVWTLHAEGLSIREISRKLNSEGYKNVTKSVIGRCVKRLETIMRQLYLPEYSKYAKRG